MYPPVVVDDNAPKPPKVSSVNSTITLCCMVLIYLQSLQLQLMANPFYQQSQQISLVLHPVNNYDANKKICDIFNSVYNMTMIIKQHKL